MSSALESQRRPLRTEPAETLAEIPFTLQPEALETPQELAAFYKDEIRELRGIDRMGEMRICLEDAHSSGFPFKAFLLGHPGVGKTTELSKLLLRLEPQFRPVRISVNAELNPATLRFYDVLLLILIRLAQEASSPAVIGFEDTQLKRLLGLVKDHLSTKWSRHLRVDEAEWGAGLQFPFLKLFGNIKQGRKYETGAEEYELSFVSDLVDLTNLFLQECSELLRRNLGGRRWLIVLEDFEKLGLTGNTLKDLFAGLRPSLQGMEANIVVVIPAWLRYSDDQGVILPPNFSSFEIADIAVFTQTHSPNEPAIAALSGVVLARANEHLFESGVLRRLCISSGGNLRDLFLLIRNAMLAARTRGAAQIAPHDAAIAIDRLRNDYEQLLGSTGQDASGVPLTAKLARLQGLYERTDPTAEVPDPILYLMFRQRCALRYNGKGWVGIHPLIVDLLIKFNRLAKDSPGGTDA